MILYTIIYLIIYNYIGVMQTREELVKRALSEFLTTHFAQASIRCTIIYKHLSFRNFLINIFNFILINQIFTSQTKYIEMGKSLNILAIFQNFKTNLDIIAINFKTNIDVPLSQYVKITAIY